MRKRFIIGLDSSNNDQDTQFVNWINERKCGWWHWLKDTWLITDSTGKLTAKEIRDFLQNTYIGINTIVIEIGDTDGTWAGYGPKSDEKNMFTWLKNTWSPKN